MELFIYICIFTLVCIINFWFIGGIYGLLRKPKIYFPAFLAAKMAISSVIGVFFFGVGGIILATLIFVTEMKKRPDHKKWPNLIAGSAISICGSVTAFFLFMFLVSDALERSI
ncbi:MAG: hypothetical protein ACPG52_02390 [Cognaticolwellia sp.]